MNRVYMCIDLKSFYASVECVERGLDPLTTNLVVADTSRTEKTICLAVSPSLKEYGLGGRARLFEVVQKVKEINRERLINNKGKKFIGKSINKNELVNKNLELDYIAATPRMSLYIKYSTEIYNIYLKYVSKDDIFVYSIDEVFCDITNYLKTSKLTPREFVTNMIHDVYKTTGITATAGIGPNLYLAKIAMDIVAKKSMPDELGVRISELDVKSYRKLLWDYTPITKFWRVGEGLAKRLAKYDMYTMGDIARCSIDNEDLLYKIFGINAELLIDHAWGIETSTMESIKAYKSKSNSISSGQVLHRPYKYDEALIIVKEMCDQLALDLTSKNMVTNQIVLNIGYDVSNETDDNVLDRYGRSAPKPSHGSINLTIYTSSSKDIIKNCTKLYKEIANKDLLIRRLNITACNLINREESKKILITKQFDLFSTISEDEEILKEIKKSEEDDKIQKVLLNIKNKYGKNSILKAVDYTEGATTRDRNNEIGGHKS